MHYVDYGNTEEVMRSQAKPLLKRFTALPAQAIACRMHGVLPLVRAVCVVPCSYLWCSSTHAHFEPAFYCLLWRYFAIVCINSRSERVRIEWWRHFMTGRQLDVEGEWKLLYTLRLQRAGHDSRQSHRRFIRLCTWMFIDSLCTYLDFVSLWTSFCILAL